MPGKFQQFAAQLATMPNPLAKPKTAPAAQGLTPIERQRLAMLSANPDFAILDRLLEFEAERFTSMLLQVDPTNPEAVISAHTRAQVAWDIVSHLRRQIAFETGEATADAAGEPQDATEDLIDQISSQLQPLL